MGKTSAGVLLFRRRRGSLEVLLVHPGGPYWAKKDVGAWSIPKGEVDEGEDLLQAALREFEEETGVRPEGQPLALTPIKQRSGKIVHAWAIEGTCDPGAIRSNMFRVEWPPRSGIEAEFPEVDRAEFFPPHEARKRINPAQASLIVELQQQLGGRIGERPDGTREPNGPSPETLFG